MSKEDLIHYESDIKKLSVQITENMIELKKLSFESDKNRLLKGSKAGESLRSQLNRVYQIDGCREVFEEITKDALYQLDAFDQKIKNPKASLKSSQVLQVLKEESKML